MDFNELEFRFKDWYELRFLDDLRNFSDDTPPIWRMSEFMYNSAVVVLGAVKF
jgi:hypothetical protein